MITRIFQVEIYPEYQADFERDFAMISKAHIENAKGLVSVEILRLLDDRVWVYAMISRWENLEALSGFAGECWQEAVIPEAMQKYAKDYHVTHFEELG